MTSRSHHFESRLTLPILDRLDQCIAFGRHRVLLFMPLKSTA
jgi:hypothetical protein